MDYLQPLRIRVHSGDQTYKETEAEMTKDTMKAVIFKEPHKVAVEDRPIPKITEPTDIIVKVINSALCGRQVTWWRWLHFLE